MTMKLAISSACLAALGLVLTAQAQSPSNPPRDSAPQKQTPSKSAPAPTKTEPRTAHPEDPHTATTGGADKQVYRTGKKIDDTAGCSTPTDAKSAGVDTSHDSAARRRSDGSRTVCTTSGAEGVGAVDKSKRKQQKDQQKSAEAPATSTSGKPR
jgi:hypothetical protein